jgi:hypothetical protein
MGIDASIALGVKPAQFESPINMMTQVQGLQNAQQENQLRQLQIQQATQAQQDNNALRQGAQGLDLTKPDGQDQYGQLILKHKGPQAYQEYAAGQAKLDKDRRDAAAAELALGAKKAEKLSSDAYGLMGKPDLTLKDVLDFADEHAAAGTMDPAAAARAHQTLTDDPVALKGALARIWQQGLDAKSQVEQQKLHFQDLGDRVAGIDAFTGVQRTDYKKGADPTVAAAGQSPTPIIIRDPTDKTGRRLIVVNGKQYQGGGGGDATTPPAPGVIGDSPKDTNATVLDERTRAKREAAYPRATSALREVNDEFDAVLKVAKELRDHKGLSNITGTLAGRTPNFSNNATDAQALLDNIQAKGQFGALSKMRAASPTGGALGNVSDTEGRTLRDSFAVLKQSQDTPAFKQHLEDYINNIEAAKARANDAYAMDYEYRNSEGGATPAAPGMPSADAVAAEIARRQAAKKK